MLTKQKNLQTSESSENERPFAQGLNFYKLFWIFFIGSIGGVIVETVWCVIRTHTIESRAGVLYGPFNPVYGIGAVLLTLCLYKLASKNGFLVFLCGTLLGGVYEYVYSYVEEYMFGTVSWEYTGSFMSIGGRTNLFYALMWGMLGLLWIKEVYPRLSRLIERIPLNIGKISTWALAVFMTFNMGISLLAVDRQADRRAGIPADNIVSEFLDQHYNDAFLEQIYPNTQFVK